MSARVTAVLDDLDSGPELERIKQHYAPTAVQPEITPEMLEMKNDFQRLQTDLHSFLLAYIGEITSLHASLSNRGANGGSDSVGHNGQSIGAPNVMDNPWPQSDPESQNQVDDCGSNLDIPHTLPPAPAPRASNIALDAHLQEMQTFLKTHLENLQALQNAIASPQQKDMQKIPNEMAPPSPQSMDRSYHEAFNQQFNMLVLISTFTAALIVAFLSLVITIIGDRHQTPFNVGMLFAFISLGIHFGNIIIAGRGVTLTAQADEGRDLEYYKFYLSVCEQLQFAATLVFIVATVIMTFFIFSSIAFPVVFLIISIIGLFVVFTSVYWEVSITYRNLTFLMKNIRRFKTSYKTISNKYNRKIFPNRFRRNRTALI